MDAQGQSWCGAGAAEEDEDDESLITEILTITPAKAVVVDTSVACLISWAGDGNDRCDYYQPDKVRIGPFHRKDPSQQAGDWMEQQKKRALRGLLLASCEEGGDKAEPREELRRYLRAMERIEPDARRCYNRTFGWMSSKEFARMLLLDGCFLYSRFVAGSGSEDIAVDRDVVFLLENQIPFFVLEEIHKLIKGGKDVSLVLHRVATRVEQVLRHTEYTAVVALDRSSCTPCHLLHLLHMCFRPAPAPDSTGSTKKMVLEHNIRVPMPQLVRWRTATQYAAAGMRFMKRELGNGDKEARSILEVELSPDGGGTLHVPRLTIDANTFRLLRNMVALEHKGLQGTSRGSRHVTAYCLFLSQLAGTEEDVALLVSKGIIVHLLHSDDDVAQELARLCDGVIIDPYDPDTSYLRPKYEELEKLICRRRCRHVLPWLRRQADRNNRLLLAFIAALLVVLLVQQSVSSALRNGRGNC